jgi:hypothetical protein
MREEDVEKWTHDKFNAGAARAAAAASAAADASAASAAVAADDDGALDVSALPPSAPLPDIFKLPCGAMPKPTRARVHALIKTNFPFLVSSFINGEKGEGGSIGIAAASAAAAIGPKRARGGTAPTPHISTVFLYCSDVVNRYRVLQ